MAAATPSAEDRSSASQQARSSASQQALCVGSEALLEIGLILLGLASLAAALSGASLMAAVLVTVAAAAFVGRVLLLPRVSRGWLGSSGGARALLVLATAASFNNSGSLTGGEVAALVAFLGAVGLIVLEPHLDRLTGARLTVVAHLPGVDPVATLPDRSRVVVLGGVLSTVAGAWSAVLGLPGWLWLGLVVLAAAPVLAWGLAGRRRVAAGIRLEEQLDRAVADYAPEYILYTARPDDASYQVLMWLPYLQRAGRRFIIVTREAVPAIALAAQTDVPVIQRRRLSDLDTVVTPATRAAFYVNASSGNGALVRYHQLTHIYLGHGDSDKPPSYNPTHAMFDRIFAAGPAAIRRYAQHGVSISLDKFDVVGRPQVEGVQPAQRPITEVERPVVLYAPTWRGHVEETLLHSLPVGDRIVRALLKRDVEVIFRPHPFSYDFEEDRESIRRIHRLLSTDAEQTGRQHRWGDAAERDLGILDCINASDAMISDVSSVVSDYLFSTKPFAMVAVSTGVQDFAEQYPIARAAYVLDGHLANLEQILDWMLRCDPLSARRIEVKAEYLGDFPADRYSDVFVDAVRRWVDEPPPVSGGGVETSEDTEPPTGVSLRTQVAALVRDAAISGAAALAAVLALAGAPAAAAVAAVVSVVAIVWSRRRMLTQPEEWTPLLGSNAIGRILLVASLPVAAVYVAPADVNRVLLAAAVLAAAIVAERTIRTALTRQSLVTSGLPGLETTVSSLAPWGTTTIISWLVIVAGWLVLASGISTAVLIGLALLQLLAFVEPWVKALIRVHHFVRAEERLRETVAAYRPEFAVYFAAAVGAGYQVGMWLPYLKRLDRRFIIITRTVAMLRQLEPLVDVPVIFRPTLRSLEDVTVDSMTTAFYVNNAARNTHFIERRQLSHIWLNHGDSEKPACYNPVHAIYDRIFAAGQAGIDRYARHGVHIPPDKFRIVGRPQVEAISKARSPIGEIESPTVLYAPTWRGPFADSRVYSLPIGEQIVTALLERGATVIFRAHPFNYRFADAAATIASIGRLLEEDRARTGRPHLWGAAAETELTVEECFNASDAMIADVSAVVSDYLQSDKPFSIVSVGRTPDQLLADAPAAKAAYVLCEDLSNLEAVLDQLLIIDSLGRVRSGTRIYYLGDFPPEHYADGFIAAARDVVDAGRP
ncbi:MAG: hypothetical protein JWN06_65 [Propionibacteriaceae bacterium]|nr:hypothetical protein [Propionibacteriaceae bacterium]